MDRLYKRVVSLSGGREEIPYEGLRCIHVISENRYMEYNPFCAFDEIRSREPVVRSSYTIQSGGEGMVTLLHQLSGYSTVENGSSQEIIKSGDACILFPGSRARTPRSIDSHEEYWVAAMQVVQQRHTDKETAETAVTPESQIPVYRGGDGLIVKILSGEFRGYTGVLSDLLPSLYLDIHIPPLSTFTHSIPDEETTFAYILEGEGDTPNMPGGRMTGGTSLLLKEGGDTVSFTAGNEELRVVLCSG